MNAVLQLVERSLLFGRGEFALLFLTENNGAPDTIRTCDLPLRRGTLYPAELRGRGADSTCWH